MNDAGSFYQMSLLAAIHPDDWPNDPVCTPEEYRQIEAGRQQRSDAGLDDAMREYNRLENAVLARLMGRPDGGLRELGIVLERGSWYGPGAAAARWLHNAEAPRRQVLEQEVLHEKVAELHGDLSGRYVVDLDGLGFLDCGGLRGLLDLAQEATAQGGRLIVTRPRGEVARVLSIVGPAEWT